MALNLSVPIASGSPGKEIETNPKKARLWVEALPLTRIADTTRQLTQVIAALNRAKMASDERIALIETYQPIIAVLLDELQAVYAYSLLPLPPKQREACDLARNLLVECSFAYKHLLIEKTGKMIMFNAKKNLPAPLFQAMHYLFGLMLLSYKVYHPVPQGVWQELHLLHQYADEQGFRAEAPVEALKISISDLYFDALMVSLADPYRLMFREVDSVMDILRQNRGQLDFRTDSNVPNPQRLFVISPGSDLAPRPLIQMSAPPNGQDVRLLDTNRFVERLTQRMQNKPVNTAKSHAAHDLTDLTVRLLRQWGDPPKRQFRRNDTEASAVVCSGIKALAHFTELASNETSDMEAKAIQDGDTIPLLNIPQDASSQALGVEEWLVLNQSANGLRMHRNEGGRVAVTVGEAVGIRLMAGRWWNIAVVRWLTVLEDNSLEFGVQLVSPSASSVTIEATIGNNTRVQPALLLAPSHPEAASDEIMTMPDTFSDLREFELVDHHESFNIRATSLQEKTSRFDLFQFSPS